MKIQLNDVLILDTESPFHNQIQSIYIEDGIIKEIGSTLKNSASRSIDLKGKWITPGWLDLSCFIGDPGFEHKEDIQSATRAAAFGGFTTIYMQPETQPVIDDKGLVSYIFSKSAEGPVHVKPIGAISSDLLGKELSEMLDLHAAGVYVFSAGSQSIQNAELLLKALQYSQTFKGIIISRPYDENLTRFGQMHEGEMSTLVGMKGMSDMSESLMIMRDLEILNYTGGRLHFQGISSASSLKLIAEAKAKGLHVTCDVPIINLLFTDKELLAFDTHYKVNPPLRTEADRKALLDGVASGLIDAITSDHRPQDVENKKLEFDLAAFGSAQLQTMFYAISQISKEVPFASLVGALTHGPRRVVNAEPLKVDVGQRAELSIFDSEHAWDYSEKTSLSKSFNSPFFGKKLKGFCMGVVNKGRFFENSI